MAHQAVPRRALLAAGGLIAGAAGLAATPGVASAAPTVSDSDPATPRAALQRLLTGNHRFASGHANHPHQSVDRLRELAAGQHPFVVTLGCADSRVPPELLFDQGLGDIFDNRVAGNVVDDILLGSIEYAVEHFEPPLLLVLGHERCGAITATIEAIETGAHVPGHIGAIVDALRPIIEPVLHRPGDKVDNAVSANVRAQARALVRTSDIIREKVEAGTLAVVGARYDLDTGRVTLVR
ncbi:carbonic anhydrase [Allorhizocola rhizosphaerae]|uniref:carbonic anhydrase n=1 Tax=Allorhizocola rhizosphaerae TaxID=1872709 RepID=UPI000E3BF7CA|nr:carbonic anhydrase [Allorhizocola rhizosphaerae]